jgi:hypothetical protein
MHEKALWFHAREILRPVPARRPAGETPAPQTLRQAVGGRRLACRVGGKSEIRNPSRGLVAGKFEIRNSKFEIRAGIPNS